MPPLGSVIGQRERRTIHLLGERVDAKQRTVPASLSSENPVLRFWGREILSHAPGAVDLSRATPSLPLLASHNADELPPIGRVENVHLDGKKLRGVLRFARTARGDELLQAVEDGDLRSLSIGYSIDEVEQAEKGADGIPTFRVTKWTLLEASLANVPADASVGIGRSLAGGKKTMKLKHGQNQEPAGNVSVGEDGAVRKERHRVEEILSIGEKWNCRELAQQYISEGKPLDAFRKALVDELGTRQAPLNPDVPFSSGTPDAVSYTHLR
ncbi:MAG: HK97 family phage prohead protease, partial [Candidatus Eisenbacteria bacterium]|nr:HK97 family phage prohead protease [Candidatus Eisenbacteria bacterium]